MPIEAQRGGEGTAYAHSQPGNRRAPRGRPDVTENLEPAGFDPWIVEPVASRYTNYAFPEFTYIYILTTRLQLNI
jgi:hypothetical protein